MFDEPRYAAVRMCGPLGKVTENVVRPLGPTGCVAMTVDSSRSSTVPETPGLVTEDVVVAVRVPATPIDHGSACETRDVDVVP